MQKTDIFEEMLIYHNQRNQYFNGFRVSQTSICVYNSKGVSYETKKLFVIATIFIIIVLMVVVAIMNFNSRFLYEEEELPTIEGTVLEINGTNILINENGYENGENYLIVSEDTVVYIGGEESDISKIEVGQRYQVNNSPT